MTDVSPVLKGAAVFLCLSLSACQGFLPRSEDPVRPPRLAAAIPAGPSSQRLDEDGYPLLGAYPGAAATQVSEETVSETRGRFSGMASARTAPATSDSYRRRVAELQAIAARQQQDARAALAPNQPIVVDPNRQQ